MASQFYNRYIPRGIANGASSENAPTVKRQKRDVNGSLHREKQASTSAESQRQLAPSAISAKKPRPELRNDEFSKGIVSVKSPSGREKEKKRSKDVNGTTKESSDHQDHVDLPQEDAKSLKQASTAIEQEKFLALRSRYESAAAKATAIDSAADVDPAGSEEQQERTAPKVHNLEPIPQLEQIGESTRTSLHAALPKWLREPKIVSASESTPFAELSLSKEVTSTLARKGLLDAFAVQSATLPLLLPGHQRHWGDICISAATGSGKTLAYALPMIESLKHMATTRLRGLIIVPTRELVNQVRETLETCSTGLGIKIGTAVGSKALGEEQQLIMDKDLVYDPETSFAKRKRKREEVEELMNWDWDELFGAKEDDHTIEGFITEHFSKIDVLICTPGRLIEHIENTKGFSLDQIEWLVIDEADRLLDESFQQWVDIVIPRLEVTKPLDAYDRALYETFRIAQQREVQKVILSATMTRDISKLMSLKLRRPKLVILEGSKAMNETISVDAAMITNTQMHLPSLLQESALPLPDTENKPVYLVRLLEELKGGLSSQAAKREQPESGSVPSMKKSNSPMDEDETSDDATSSTPSSSEEDAASPDSDQLPHSNGKGDRDQAVPATLIFTNTNENALRLSRLLCLLLPAWAPLIKALTKSIATSVGRNTLKRFRDRDIAILVASDRASRGLDLSDLSFVINYDMPTSLTSYVHRVGRTARAGKAGQAITLVSHHEARWFWNSIARSQEVGRGPGNKVQRMVISQPLQESERVLYQKALERLGREARDPIASRADNT